MNIRTTVQDAIRSNANKVKAWDKAHTETTYTKYKPYLRWLMVFAYTSIRIWIKALLTGKMSLKNIALVLGTSIPLMLIGDYVAINIWQTLGGSIFYVGQFIFFGACILLVPINMLKIIAWGMECQTGQSSGPPIQRYHGDWDPDACCGPSYDEHVAGGGNR